jgi:hypothetical protein
MASNEQLGAWRKSAYSGTNGNCVETASADGAVMIRDTTDRAGVTLMVHASAWMRFVRDL